jgi:receptor expression-enhancing protein 5/6
MFAEDDTQWLCYWTTFACFSVLDFFAENIYRFFPLYWLAKLCFLVYLALPQTNGAHNLYVKYVDPAFDTISPFITESLGSLGLGSA